MHFAFQAWCTKSTQCEGFSFRTADGADGQPSTVWFKDPSQVYFMDGSGNKYGRRRPVIQCTGRERGAGG